MFVRSLRAVHGTVFRPPACVRSFSMLPDAFLSTERGRSQSQMRHQVTVFGANGYLGNYLIPTLAYMGFRIVIPFRCQEDGVKALKMSGQTGQVNLVPFELCDTQSVAEAIEGSDVVINCIGSQFETRNFKHKDLAHGAGALAEIAQHLGVSRFIHISHIGADETSKSKFFTFKGMGERLVKEAFPEATIVRPCHLWSPERGFHSFVSCAKKFQRCMWVLNGKQKIQPVFADDVGQGIAACIVQPWTRKQTLEFGGPEVYTREALFSRLFEMNDPRLQYEPFEMPFPLAYVYGYLSEFTPVRSRKWDRDGFLRQFIDQRVRDGAHTLADLGIQGTPLERCWNTFFELPYQVKCYTPYDGMVFRRQVELGARKKLKPSDFAFKILHTQHQPKRNHRGPMQMAMQLRDEWATTDDMLGENIQVQTEFIDHRVRRSTQLIRHQWSTDPYMMTK